MRSFFPLAIGATAGAAGVLLVRQRHTTRQFERLSGATFEALLNAIGANDPVTGAHVRRVARYALVLADAAGIDERTKCQIERIALFHDVGKIDEALFDVIHDDSTLTPEERQAIRTHPRRGADVLEPLASFYPELPEGVLSHHERWDGTGYPRHLRGQEIPLPARIVAIADSFDAITHSRRYSHGRSIAAAADAIRKGRGTQFDPQFVDLFLTPAVQRAIEAAMRAANAPPPSDPDRRDADVPMPAPDVSFRWRDTAPAQHPRDPELRESPV